MLKEETLAIVGLGRMGTTLARLWAPFFRLHVYDQDSDITEWTASELQVCPHSSLAEIASVGRIVLALPDEAIFDCLQQFNNVLQPVTLISIATNLDQAELIKAAAPHVCCCCAKFVGHAAEMALGMKPLAVISTRPADKMDELKHIFGLIAEVTTSDRDIVKEVNTLAAQEGLQAGVNIETKLHRLGYTDERVIRSAIELVGAGTLRSYAAGNLGPFARKLADQIKSHSNPS